MSERIWNGTVVKSRDGKHKGVVISQTRYPEIVVVRWEGGMAGEWEEIVAALIPLDEKPLIDGTRAYSGVGND